MMRPAKYVIIELEELSSCHRSRVCQWWIFQSQDSTNLYQAKRSGTIPVATRWRRLLLPDRVMIVLAILNCCAVAFCPISCQAYFLSNKIRS